MHGKLNKLEKPGSTLDTASKEETDPESDPESEFESEDDFLDHIPHETNNFFGDW